ncbi:DUF4339 domain-containing protein [Sorangium cellulosum]|uniref:DUF4339 domain-containing protein n=1 Tax=Sorangium cellulosum TaxID=56 RepID=UPI0004286FB1|nr:DUF4339 domain-containing protein [Sorangium cellulosum]
MGPSAAYKVEGLCDGVPAPSGVEGRGQGHLSLCSAPTMPFSSHASSAEEPAESRPWCVDRGDWLEAMSTVALWRALELGELPHSTRVWREGLECWTPAGEVKALGWTVSQPPPRDEAPALSAAGEGPESTGPLSFALTPDHLRPVAPRPHRGGPRDERADSFLLAPFPPAEAAARHEATSPPISLEIPSCFPAVPSSPPDTLPSAGTARAGAAKPGPGPARGARDADQAPRGRASGTWSRLARLTRLARRARASRSAVSIAAGSAAIVLALGLSVLSALAPAGAPSPAAAAPAARHGVAQGVAVAAAQVVVPAPALAGAAGAAALSAAAAPEPTPALAKMPLSQASSGRAMSSRMASRSTARAPSRRRSRVSRVRGSSAMTTTGAGAAPAEGAGAAPADGAGAAPAEGAGAAPAEGAGAAPAEGAGAAPAEGAGAAPAEGAGAAPAEGAGAAPAEGAGAAPAEGAGAAPAKGAGAALAEGAGAPALPPQRAGKAPAAGAKPAPLGRRERGQVRLRRGRYEPDGARGIGHPGRGAGPSVGTGAILRDSR